MKAPEFARRMFTGLRGWPQGALLAHVRLIGAMVLVLGLVAATLLSVRLFLLEAEEGGTSSPERSRRLATETIDRLELWIEEVDAERATGFPTASRALFVVEDLPHPAP